MSYVEYPSTASEGNPISQIKEIKNYLYRLADTINHNVDSEGADKLLEKALKYMESDAESGGELSIQAKADQHDKALATFNNLKQMIIATASDVVWKESDPIVQRFTAEGKYTSDKFGALDLLLDTEIKNSADGLQISSKKLEKIENNADAALTQYNGYINVGWLDSQRNIWGIDVGCLTDKTMNPDGSTATTGGQSNKFIRITPTELKFMVKKGTKETALATMSDTEITFPNAKITGGEIIIGDDFQVTNAGKVIAKNIQVSDKSKIGGWSIDGSVLKGSSTQNLTIPLISLDIQIIKTIRLDPDPTTNFISVSTQYKGNNVSVVKDNTFVLDKDGRISSHLNFSGTGKYLRFYNGIAGNDIDSVNELYTNIIGYSSNNNLILGDPSFGVGETSGYGVFLFGRAAYFSDINKASGNNTYTNYELWHQGNAPVKVNQQIQSWINNNIYIYHESKNTDGKYTGGKIYAQLGGTSAFTAEQLIGFTSSGNLAIGYTDFTGNINLYGAKVNLNGSQLALKSDIPSLTNYALKSDIPSLTNYALKSDIPSLSGYAKTTDLPYIVRGSLQFTLPINGKTMDVRLDLNPRLKAGYTVATTCLYAGSTAIRNASIYPSTKATDHVIFRLNKDTGNADNAVNYVFEYIIIGEKA